MGRHFIRTLLASLVISLFGLTSADAQPRDIRAFWTTHDGTQSGVVRWDPSGPTFTLLGTPITYPSGGDGIIFHPNGTDVLVGADDHVVSQPTSGAPATNINAPGSNIVADHITLDIDQSTSIYVWVAETDVNHTTNAHQPIIERVDVNTGVVDRFDVEDGSGNPIGVSGIAIVDLSGVGGAARVHFITDDQGNLYTLDTSTNPAIATLFQSNLQSNAHQVMYDPFTESLFVMGTGGVDQVNPISGAIIAHLPITNLFNNTPGIVDNGATTNDGLLLFTNVPDPSNQELGLIDVSAIATPGTNALTSGSEIIAPAINMPDGIDDIAPLSPPGNQGDGSHVFVGPRKIDFTYVAVGNSSTNSFRIDNVGNQAATINSLILNDPDGGSNPFTISKIEKDGQDQALTLFDSPQTLAADSFFDIFIDFSPGSGDEDMTFDSENISITIENSDGNGNPLTPETVVVSLCGNTNTPSSNVTLHFGEMPHNSQGGGNVRGQVFARPGGQAIVDVRVESNTEWAGLQYRFRITDQGDESGNPSQNATFVNAINDLENRGFTLSVGQPDNDGYVTVLLFHSGGSTITDPDIVVMELVFDIPEQSPPYTQHWIDIDVDEITFSDPDSNPLSYSLWPGTIHVGEYGDIAGGVLGGGDGEVNILDVIKLIKYILHLIPQPDTNSFAFWQTDRAPAPDGDDRLDVLDLVWMVGQITNQNNGGGNVKSVVQPVAVNLDAVQIIEGNRMVIPVRLDSDGDIAALQAAFTFDPTMVSLGQPQITDRSHAMSIEVNNDDGTFHVLAYSFDGNVIPAGSGVTLLIPVTLLEGSGGSPTITLSEIKLAGSQATALPIQIGNAIVKASTAPSAYALSANVPNPFNPSTTIAYEVPAQAHVTLTVYNMLGQEVVRLVDQVQNAGRYQVIWNARNNQGQAVSSGVYMYRLSTDDGFTDSKRMTLLK